MRYKTLLSVPLIITTIFLSTLTHANIHEVKSVVEIQKALNKIPKDALCLVDLDETVIVNAQLLGSSRWFYAKLKDLGTYSTNKEQVKAAVLRQYYYAHNFTKVHPVEKHTKNFIDDLHNNHHVLFITARDTTMLADTERQLTDNALLFNQSEHFKGLSHGIAYCNGQDKGICLEQYLASIGCDLHNFSYIVGIDDKASNLQTLQRVADNLRMPFIGFRYGALDDLVVSTDDLQIAQKQYELHKQEPDAGFISDIEAKLLLDNYGYTLN